MRIVLLGAPGAGKGTQAKRLADAFDMLHLSSGDILRAEKASGSELGAKLAEYMDSGRLVPDDVVVGVMAKAIADPSAAKGLLLDGFPRTVCQAEALDAQLVQLGASLDKVVVIDVSEDAVVERICGRRSCPQCGAIYHVAFLKPAVDGVCDKCGFTGELDQRDDDKEDVVRQRLVAYKELTAPLIDYYTSTAADKVLSFDGNKGPDEVTADMAAALGM
jgi:adenylate kinase